MDSGPSKRTDITRITLPNEADLSFSLVDPLVADPTNPTFTPTEPNNFNASFPELKRKLYSAVNEGDAGELAISLPETAIKRIQGAIEGSTPGATADALAFEPIVLTVEYELQDPTEGVQFVGKDGNSGIPHIYTWSSGGDAARCWMPCIDTLWDRCSWEIQLIVPRHLSLVADNPTNEAGASTEVIEELPVLAVASGELVEQIGHPQDPSKVIFRYSQALPTSAQHIGFAIGPFHIFDLCPPLLEDAPMQADGHAKLHAFCLPGQEDDLLHSVSFARQALDFYANDYGSYPFGSYKLVFINDPGNTVGEGLVHNTATMTIFPGDLLYPLSVIEQGFETRQTIATALASQWIGVNIVQKTWADTWLANGIALHLSAMFLRKLMGVNEYRFRLKKDMMRCCAQDTTMPPICEPGVDHPPEADVQAFVNLKAPLVLHILNQKLLKTGISHGLPRVLSKIFLSAISGELRDGFLSTQHFVKTCRKVSGTDLRLFVEQWIYHSGCPQFDVKAVFNRKKMAIELSITQDSPAFNYSCRHDTPWQEIAHCYPVDYYEGQMTIRVHEADGTPYEHVLDIRHPPPGTYGPHTQNYTVPFNTKYKRVRRQRKKFEARAEAAKAAGKDQTEEVDDLNLIDMSYGCNVLEDEAEQIEWRIADWSQEDEERMAQATYEWIRLDADFEWICTLQFDQPDYMWISQLQRDRDTVAQLEAVRALSMIPTAVVASALIKTVLLPNYFFRIRTEAILALAAMATPQVNNIGLFYLSKLYYMRYCYQQPNVDHTRFNLSPKPNNFDDFVEYFIQLAILTSLSNIRTPQGEAYPEITRFFIHLLTYNDNTSNFYSDSNYLITIFQALSHTLVAVAHAEISELFSDSFNPSPNANFIKAANEEVSRYMTMDRLVPSHRNAVTVAGLEWKTKLMLAGLIPVDLRQFFACTREGNYPPIRMLALDALLLFKGFKDRVFVDYVFEVLGKDTSGSVRRHLVASLVHCLPLISVLDGAGLDQDDDIIEEDMYVPEIPDKPLPQTFSAPLAIENIRKEYAHSPTMQSHFMSLLTNSSLPTILRYGLLKLCETLFEPADEPVPKLKLKIPLNLAPVLPKTALPRINLKLAEPTEGSVAQVSQAPRFTMEQSRLPLTYRDESPDEPLRIIEHYEPIVKPKKVKLLKSQAGGMSLDDVKICRNVLQKLLADKMASLFRNPVDGAVAPGYYDIIKRPMNLMWMNSALENGQYANRGEFKRDFKLIVSNAIKYNGEESPVAQLARDIETKFNRTWSKVDRTLESVQKKIRAPNKPAPRPSHPKVSAAKPPVVKFKVPTTSNWGGESQSNGMPPPPLPKPTLKLSFSARTKKPADDDIQEIPRPVQSLPPPPLPPSNAPPAFGAIRLASAPKDVATTAPIVAENTRQESPAVAVAKSPAAMKVEPTTENSTQSMREDGVEILPARQHSQVDFTPTPTSPSVPQAAPISAPPQVAQPSSDFDSARSSPEQPIAIAPPRPLIKIKPTFSVKLAKQEQPPPSRSSSVDPTSFDPEKARITLLRIFNMDQAIYFRKPVDADDAGCSSYYDVIKDPMDIGTMLTKLDSAMYDTRADIDRDFELIVNNCNQFNPAGTVPVQFAAQLDSAWRNAGFGTTTTPPKALSSTEKKRLLAVMKDFTKRDKDTFSGLGIFQEAVDPIRLNIPQYYDFVPRANARDMGLIRERLTNDVYKSIEEFEADFSLMLNNALAFNPPGSPIHDFTLSFKQQFEMRMQQIRAELNGNSASKRQGSHTSAGPKKRSKYIK